MERFSDESDEELSETVKVIEKKICILQEKYFDACKIIEYQKQIITRLNCSYQFIILTNCLLVANMVVSSIVFRKQNKIELI
jgi:hypothetical protein